jgi:hypothetical protein
MTAVSCVRQNALTDCVEEVLVFKNFKQVVGMVNTVLRTVKLTKCKDEFTFVN